jgi:hypothetical protein
MGCSGTCGRLIVSTIISSVGKAPGRVRHATLLDSTRRGTHASPVAVRRWAKYAPRNQPLIQLSQLPTAKRAAAEMLQSVGSVHHVRRQRVQWMLLAPTGSADVSGGDAPLPMAWVGLAEPGLGFGGDDNCC